MALTKMVLYIYDDDDDDDDVRNDDDDDDKNCDGNFTPVRNCPPPNTADHTNTYGC